MWQIPIKITSLPAYDCSIHFNKNPMDNKLTHHILDPSQDSPTNVLQWVPTSVT